MFIDAMTQYYIRISSSKLIYGFNAIPVEMPTNFTKAMKEILELFLNLDGGYIDI